MNLILLFPDDFVNSTCRVRVQGRRLRQVLDVHRASADDELCVGLAGGLIGTGRVISLSRECLEMDVRFVNAPPPALPVTLILSLPRPKVLRRVLRSASSMGVKRIILLNSFRVEKSFWQSPFLDGARLKEELILGLEQARDTVLPEVMLRPLFKPFVEDELPVLIHGTLPLVAHPAATEPCPRDPNCPVTIIIGPEGGFIPYEIEKLASLGFIPIHVGERILSVETVLPFLLARLF
jgi:16S rRNA (uracil1498-N3)-methyltransferase